MEQNSIKKSFLVRKMALSVVLIIASIMMVATVISLYSDLNKTLDGVQKNADFMKTMMSEPLSQLIWNVDYEQVNKIIDASLNSSNLIGVIVKDASGSVILGRVINPDRKIVNYNSDLKAYLDEFTYIFSIYQLQNTSSDNFGRIEYYFSDYFAKREIYSQIGATIFKTTFLAIVCIIFISININRHIINPIISLRNTVRNFSRGNFSARSVVIAKDEIGDLAEQFNHMADTIQRHNEELQVLVDQRTKQLLQAEKMASLGELVAGVSHEINTPVGIGVTASTHLKSITKRFSELFHSGDATKTDFENFLNEIDESVTLINSNLNRAADLVHSFKKVAVDRSSEELREFNVRQYLNDILLSLRPWFKKTAHTVEIDCPENLVIKSFPGALSQIITNLIVNSLIHGFEDMDAGKMRISITNENGNIIIIYTDNGCGIPRDKINRIFEPFFTTKRNTGGSGLGLNITLNLVTHTLKGNIVCESDTGKGVKFIITFPEITE